MGCEVLAVVQVRGQHSQTSSQPYKDSQVVAQMIARVVDPDPHPDCFSDFVDPDYESGFPNRFQRQENEEENALFS
jgi:hypothetical protein